MELQLIPIVMYMLPGEFDSDTIYFGTSTLINYGGGDVFVAKYDSSGNALWAKGAGGTSTDYGNGVSIDTAGNVLLVGTFVSPVISFDTIKIRNKGGGCCAEDIYIAKYTSTGNLLWAKSAGGTGSDYGRGIVTDIAGNSYITGQFSSPLIAFDNDTLANNASSLGAKLLSSDIFLPNMIRAGMLFGQKGQEVNANDYACGIAIFNTSIYLTGAFPTIQLFLIRFS